MEGPKELPPQPFKLILCLLLISKATFSDCFSAPCCARPRALETSEEGKHPLCPAHWPQQAVPAGGWGSCRAGSASMPHTPVSMGLGKHLDIIYNFHSATCLQRLEPPIKQQKQQHHFFKISSPNTCTSLKTFLPLQPAFVFFFSISCFSLLC